MSDSNPRSGDWDNTMRGVMVFAGTIILLVVIIVLGVTGHEKASLYLFTALCVSVIVTAAIRAGRHERDH